MQELTLTLPPQGGGLKEEMIVLPSGRQMTIVGGSGAGKTRFMRWLLRQVGPRGYAVTALGGLVCADTESSVVQAYMAHPAARNFQRGEGVTDLSRLLSMVLHDEFVELIRLKMEGEGFNKDVHATRLDKVVEAWERIFPGNKILRVEGELAFATGSGKEPIGMWRLSEGERSVLYYLLAVTYAPKRGIVFVDEPAIFLHPALLQMVWNEVEGLRPDCVFVYNTGDVDFANSRTGNVCIWVKHHDAEREEWDYEVLEGGEIPDELSLTLLGARRPVLFIEGDAQHSLDAKLYPLVYPEYVVRPLGSCDKVIEATRALSGLTGLHRLQGRGIVDRDRRTGAEVAYLRKRGVMVPAVAEIENLFLLPEVVEEMARMRGRNGDKVFDKVKRSVIRRFGDQINTQVMEHVRHRMKRVIECKADVKASDIEALERHLRELPGSIDVRGEWERLTREFHSLHERRDYKGILMVFNHKPLLGESGLVQLLGLRSKGEYHALVLAALKERAERGEKLRRAIRDCLEG